MSSSQALRLRKAQQIEELRYRLQYCTSCEERETIRRSLDFWTRFTIPADLQPVTVPESLPTTPNLKGFHSLPRWLTQKLQPAIH
ncbi:hypothetical protein [Trichothermofontia sp.]